MTWTRAELAYRVGSTAGESEPMAAGATGPIARPTRSSPRSPTSAVGADDLTGSEIVNRWTDSLRSTLAVVIPAHRGGVRLAMIARRLAVSDVALDSGFRVQLVTRTDGAVRSHQVAQQLVDDSPGGMTPGELPWAGEEVPLCAS